MKVLDLQCGNGHGFEGWFGSEDDFQGQLARSLVECPLCGDHGIVKKLSAPRLNLGAAQPPGQSASEGPSGPDAHAAELMRMARHVLANTEDVGERFASEARRMHYGEAKERNIRGQASHEETMELLDEGISVMPLPLPKALKDTLQ